MKRTIIIGRLSIELDVQQPINKIEIYDNNKLSKTIDQEPYQWIWKRGSILKHRHKIKIILYNDYGEEIYSENLELLRFL